MSAAVVTITAYRLCSCLLGQNGLVALFVATTVVGLPVSSFAQASSPLQVKQAATAERGIRWQDLTSVQRAQLQSLERDWSGIDTRQKQKWLELSTRMPSMPTDERQRIQARMADWAKLTPDQRGQARLRFQEAKQLPVQDRQDRWDAYQSLSAEQKKQLAARALPAASSASTADLSRKSSNTNSRTDKWARDVPQPKSNIVPNPAFAVSPKMVAPAVVQARPGATTTLITRLPAPPLHEHTGMPKIAATPEFVNKATLLPKRGPQAAASRATTPASGAGTLQTK